MCTLHMIKQYENIMLCFLESLGKILVTLICSVSCMLHVCCHSEAFFNYGFFVHKAANFSSAFFFLCYFKKFSLKMAIVKALSIFNYACLFSLFG